MRCADIGGAFRNFNRRLAKGAITGLPDGLALDVGSQGNRGLARGELAKGTIVEVEGYPKRTDAGELRAERITIGQKTTELR